MADVIQVLRGLHILFAILWAGGAAYRFFVVEKLLDGGFASRFFASGLHGKFMGMTATVTIIFGGITMGINSDAYSIEAIGNGAWMLGLGMGFALLAYGMGIFVHIPIDKKIQPLAQAALDGKPHDEAAYQGLMAREAKSGRISMALIGLATLLMLTFRWF